MNCPNCGSTNIKTETVTEWVAYGEEAHAYQASFPTMTCSDCHFGWRDYRAEEAIDAALQEYLSGQGTEKDDVAAFAEKIREVLAEYQYENNKEQFREALLLLAAEL
jgi:hypothetical protein